MNKYEGETFWEKVSPPYPLFKNFLEIYWQSFLRFCSIQTSSNVFMGPLPQKIGSKTID